MHLWSDVIRPLATKMKDSECPTKPSSTAQHNTTSQEGPGPGPYGATWVQVMQELGQQQYYPFLGGQFMVVELFKRFFCFKLLPLWARFCLKIIDFDKKNLKLLIKI